MQHMSLENLGRRVAAKRGKNGIRAAAKEIGVSPSTLSRIENGHLPDLETFKKICDWLNIDPGTILGTKVEKEGVKRTTVHFKKNKTIEPKTASALAQMILAAQRAMEIQEGEFCFSIHKHHKVTLFA